MAIKPAINFDKVSGGMVSLNTGLGKLKNSSDTVKIASLNSVKIKRESIARNRILSNMREEKIKLREQESLVEASSPNGAFKRTSSIIGNSTRGFLDRILDFSSSLLIGWLLYNLPTIMTAIEDLIIRIKSLYGVLTGFMSNLTNTFENFGNLLSAVYQNVTQFDFMDNSKKVQTAIDDLNSNFDLMHDQFMEGFDLLKVPLGEGPGEEPIPELNTDYTQPAPTTGGTKEQRALLDAISYAEGTRKSYGTIYGGKVVPELERGQLTVGQVLEMQRTGMLNGKSVGYKRDQHNSDATGRYQFMSYTLKEEIEKQGISLNEKFTPALQDKIILSRISTMRGVTPELLKKEGLSAKVSNMLSPEFASFPTYSGNSYHGQPVKSLKSIRNSYQESLSSSTRSTQIVQVPPGKINPIVGDRLGAGRNHGGTDLAVNSGTPLRAVSDGVIVDSDFEKGWGNFLVMKDNLGIYHLYGHMQSGYKRSGSVKKGEIIGKVGMTGRTTGPHLHWEAGTGWNGGKITGRFDPLNKYSKFAPFNTPYSDKSNTVQVSSPTSSTQLSPRLFQTQTPGSQQAQVSSTTARGQNVPSIGNNRRGQQVIIADNPQQPQPQQVSSKSSGGEFEIILAEDSLNSLIKNQILLELAYT